MRYLVTGATGFLGTHLVASLEARGHDVAPFSRRHGGDVLDPAAVRAAAAGCDGAFHCAGKVSRKPGDAEALSRFAAAHSGSVIPESTDASQVTAKLADAQFVIARELRFASWTKLKAHITATERQRAAIDGRLPPPDSDLKTLHIRCGHAFNSRWWMPASLAISSSHWVRMFGSPSAWPTRDR